MRDLMDYAQKNELRPSDALNALVTTYDDQQPPNQQQGQGQQPQQGQPNHAQLAMMQRNGMGQGTPSQAHMQLPQGQQQNFSSPMISTMSLPMHMNGGMGLNGSPHIAQHPGLPGANLAPNHNLNLGQNHTPSPAQAHMAAPPMMPQHSQQGTNSSAASTNTSPNMNNKRRRSQVKMEEGDGGGGDINGPQNQRVKASPRVGGKKGKN